MDSVEINASAKAKAMRLKMAQHETLPVLPVELRKVDASEEARILQQLERCYREQVESLGGGLKAGRHRRPTPIELEFHCRGELTQEGYFAELLINGASANKGKTTDFLHPRKPSLLRFEPILRDETLRTCSLTLGVLPEYDLTPLEVRSLHLQNVCMRPERCASSGMERSFFFAVQAAGAVVHPKEVELTEGGVALLNQVHDELQQELVRLSKEKDRPSLESFAQRLEEILEQLYPCFREGNQMGVHDFERILELFTPLATVRALLPVLSAS